MKVNGRMIVGALVVVALAVLGGYYGRFDGVILGAVIGFGIATGIVQS